MVERLRGRSFNVVLGVACTLLAAGWIALNATQHAAPDIAIAVNVQEFEDPSDALTIYDVAGSHRFHPVESTPANPSSATWFRFTVPSLREPFVIALDGQPDYAELYVRKRDGTYAVASFGGLIPFDRRPFRTSEVATELAAGSHAGSDAYIHTYGNLQTFGTYRPIEFQTRENFIEREGRDVGESFGFTGFFIAMALVSVFFGLYLRERIFALHAALMMAAVVWDLSERYLAWQFVWPWASIGAKTGGDVTFAIYLLVLLFFARSFLGLKDALPVFDRVLWGVFASTLIVMFVVDPIAGPVAGGNLQSSLQFMPFLLLPIAGLVRWRSGFRQARFFVLGFAGLLFVFVTAIIFVDSPYSPWAIDTGVAWESLFFQFAIADRMLSVIRERDRAQQAELSAQSDLSESRRASIERLETYTEAFGRFVPREFLAQLGREDVVSVRLGDSVARKMAVLFSDIRSFTNLADVLPPEKTFAFINEYLSRVGPVVRAHGGFVDKFIGDGMLALFPDPDCAVDAAIELHQTVRRFNELRARSLLSPIAVGAGLHYGDVMLGTIGEERRYETTVISSTVNVASRLEGITKTFGSHIIVSDDLVRSLADRSAFRLRQLCPVSLRGASVPVTVHEVCDADEPELLLQKMATMEIFESGVAAYEKGDFAAAAPLFQEVVRRSPGDAPAAFFLNESTRVAR